MLSSLIKLYDNLFSGSVNMHLFCCYQSAGSEWVLFRSWEVCATQFSLKQTSITMTQCLTKLCVSLICGSTIMNIFCCHQSAGTLCKVPNTLYNFVPLCMFHQILVLRNHMVKSHYNLIQCRQSFRNKAIFFFNWPLSFSIFSYYLQFQKTQKQEKSRITT